MIVLLSTVKITYAQSTRNKKEQSTNENKSIPPIQDLNANGIDDAKETAQSGKKTLKKLRDQFIDANGDGICDNREQGLGFRRGKMETGKQTGKRQQGKQK